MARSATEQPGEHLARSPGPSYQDLLDRESNQVPDSLRENTNPYLGSENLDTQRYLSRDFHELEVAHVWTRTWQAVCRETEVAEAGDTHPLRYLPGIKSNPRRTEVGFGGRTNKGTGTQARRNCRVLSPSCLRLLVQSRTGN